jgi:hypothetical protein
MINYLEDADEAPILDAGDYDFDGECPELPWDDGTYEVTQHGWKPAEHTTGYWVSDTDGDYDESGAELGEFVGKWTDRGRTYIDHSYWFEDRAEAIAAGRRWEQLAIWDIEADAEITL